jgi:hypothetical protein
MKTFASYDLSDMSQHLKILIEEANIKKKIEMSEETLMKEYPTIYPLRIIDLKFFLANWLSKIKNENLTPDVISLMRLSSKDILPDTFLFSDLFKVQSPKG